MAKRYSKKRVSRESAIPAHTLTPWQRYQYEIVWKLRTYVHSETGLIMYIIPHNILGTIIEHPGKDYIFEPAGFFTIYQLNHMIASMTFEDSVTNETFFLIEVKRLPHEELPVIKQIKEPPPPKIGRKPKIEPPPKTARLRQAVREGDKHGTLKKFNVVQVSKDFAHIQDIDESPPKGFRTPKGAIGKIKTDRGVQYIYPPDHKYDGLGDSNYENVSQDRGSYDIRTTRRNASGPGYINSRRLVSLGDGRKGGKYSRVINAIALAFIRGGGKF